MFSFCPVPSLVFKATHPLNELRPADLCNAVRRGRCDEVYAERSLARLGRLAILRDEETDRQAWGMTRQLLREENLTLYDAAYFELALRKGFTLASCDAALIAAASRRAVDVLSARLSRAAILRDGHARI